MGLWRGRRGIRMNIIDIIKRGIPNIERDRKRRLTRCMDKEMGFIMR